MYRVFLESYLFEVQYLNNPQGNYFAKSFLQQYVITSIKIRDGYNTYSYINLRFIPQKNTGNSNQIETYNKKTPHLWGFLKDFNFKLFYKNCDSL